jgi:hypothetical protein
MDPTLLDSMYPKLLNLRVTQIPKSLVDDDIK